MAKLRSSSRRGLRNGFSAVRQCTTKIQKASAPIRAHRMISRESNQSRRWPRSKISCAAMMAVERARKPIQSKCTGLRSVWSASANQMHDQRTHARRHDHEEGGAPVVGLGRDAAEDRSEHRAEHRADAPHHQGQRLQVAREGAEQDGLPHRHDRRAEQALGDAGQDQRLQAVGDPAQEGRDREAEHGEEHRVAPAEPAGQPAGHRRGDGGGHQVQRDHPGDLVLRRREGAAHLRQHQVGQRDGHAEQHVGQLHHQQDQPLPAAEAEQAALRSCGTSPVALPRSSVGVYGPSSVVSL